VTAKHGPLGAARVLRTLADEIELVCSTGEVQTDEVTVMGTAARLLL